MIKIFLIFLNWTTLSFTRLLRVAPLQVHVSVLTSLFSQVFQIAAFLLPLKVMILLGASGVPKYFPSFLIDIERERLILMLSAASVVLYLLHLLMDFIGAALAERVSRLLVNSSQDKSVLPKQKKVALYFYKGAITVASGFILVFSVLIFLSFFNKHLLFLVMVYFFLVFIGSALLFFFYPRMFSRALFEFVRVVDVLSAFGFLLAFGFLVIDFLYRGATNLFLGIVTLLLCRQMFSRFGVALKNLKRLFSNRERFLILGIEAREHLAGDGWKQFLLGRYVSNVNGGVLSTKQGQNLIEGASGQVDSPMAMVQTTYWEVINPSLCRPWLISVLGKVGIETVPCKIKQYDEALRGQLLLHVECTGLVNPTRVFLFKVFSRQQARSASQVADTLAVYSFDASLKILDVSMRHGFTAHLYEWASDALPVSDALELLKCREQLFIESLGRAVPADHLDPAKRQSLRVRYGAQLWSRCQAFSRWHNMETRQLVDFFVQHPSQLSDVLTQMPFGIYNPGVIQGRVYRFQSGYKITWWGDSTLEPLGTGWPVELGLERLNEILSQENICCGSLINSSPAHIYLSSLAFEFERLCELGSYSNAFYLLEQMRDLLTKIGR